MTPFLHNYRAHIWLRQRGDVCVLVVSVFAYVVLKMMGVV